MVYIYKDDFMVNSVDSTDLEKQEAHAIVEVDLLNVVEEPYREKLVIYSVYMELALMQMEADGMMEKYNAYSKEFKRYLTLATTSNISTISNIPIGRG